MTILFGVMKDSGLLDAGVPGCAFERDADRYWSTAFNFRRLTHGRCDAFGGSIVTDGISMCARSRPMHPAHRRRLGHRNRWQGPNGTARPWPMSWSATTLQYTIGNTLRARAINSKCANGHRRRAGHLHRQWRTGRRSRIGPSTSPSGDLQCYTHQMRWCTSCVDARSTPRPCPPRRPLTWSSSLMRPCGPWRRSSCRLRPVRWMATPSG